MEVGIDPWMTSLHTTARETAAGLEVRTNAYIGTVMPDGIKATIPHAQTTNGMLSRQRKHSYDIE